ncbi:MAG: type II toxin-antitoxin system HicB family antitoxin [Gemmatimonadetes bacterium]|nr:type II toxin-antitoxin system HicB family antitoxin [Gemmatimonadota bacterium]MDE2733372.1 type II toxin-antitoxin system HicB family antitoxin [Gemmatimonadota bacterium]MYA21633.1 type II toxin-antitoxin system HicB family antitoxin [Gemmatimonadota bacterium]
MKYSVVIEKTDNGYSAYAPDLPGCIAAGDSQVEVEELIREAIIMHLESLREHGDPVPEPQTSVALVEV